jgi:DNA-binding beta-propeller fold protein YncE
MRHSFTYFCAFILLFLSACATAPKQENLGPVFYPEPPAPPRVQYLRSYGSSKDVGAKRSAFAAFVTGERERITILDKPYGIASHNGKIYVCDTNATVMVFDIVKNTFDRLPGAQGLGKLVQPLNIHIDKDGNKYVADPVRQQVVMYDKSDFYVKAFGPVEGWRPVDAAVFEDRLYVVDSKNGEIMVFDLRSGDLLKRFGKTGTDEQKLGLPTNIAFDSAGYLYVSDASRFQIVKLDRDGNFRGTIGSLGTHPGAFARPRGIALDRENRLYAVDAAFNNVQVFNKDARLLLFFGKGGNAPGDLYLGAKVAVDYDDVKYFQKYADPNFQIEYLLFVTSQFGDRKVNVYGVGTEKGRKYPTDEESAKEITEKKLKFKQEHPEAAQEKDAENKQQ